MGCTSDQAILSKKTSCPNVLFASEHSTYIASNTQPITLNNVSYKANINNYEYSSECLEANDKIKGELSLLFIVKPIQADVKKVFLPFYVAILNANDELLDMQYYSVKDNLQKDEETNEYIETEIRTTINVQLLTSIQQNYDNIFVIGFMLDEKKLSLLN